MTLNLIFLLLLCLMSISLLNPVRKGVPIVAQVVTNPTTTHEDADLIPGLAQWVKASCGVVTDAAQFRC